MVVWEIFRRSAFPAGHFQFAYAVHQSDSATPGSTLMRYESLGVSVAAVRVGFESPSSSAASLTGCSAIRPVQCPRAFAQPAAAKKSVREYLFGPHQPSRDTLKPTYPYSKKGNTDHDFTQRFLELGH
jgi:hypothetical protein